MNPKLIRLGLYLLSAVLAALGGANDVFAATGADAAVVPPEIAHLALLLGGLVGGYAKTARTLGDVPMGEIEHEYRQSERPDA